MSKISREGKIISSEIILFFTRKQKHIYQKKDYNKAAGRLEPLNILHILIIFDTTLFIWISITLMTLT